MAWVPLWMSAHKVIIPLIWLSFHAQLAVTLRVNSYSIFSHKTCTTDTSQSGTKQDLTCNWGNRGSGKVSASQVCVCQKLPNSHVIQHPNSGNPIVFIRWLCSDSFQGIVRCLRIQRNQHTLRLGTGVSSWRGSGLTGVLDGETRTGVDPAYRHKILADWCDHSHNTALYKWRANHKLKC